MGHSHSFTIMFRQLTYFFYLGDVILDRAIIESAIFARATFVRTEGG